MEKREGIAKPKLLKRAGWTKSLLGAAVLSLLSAVSMTGYSSAFDPPAIDLAHLRLGSTHAVAKTKTGGLARLTLDPELCRAASRLLDLANPLEGALVAIDVKTSKILVWSEIRRGGAPGSVILGARTPAASVFKLVTTAALFENGKVRPSDRVCISGGARRIEPAHLDVPSAGADVNCGPFSDALGHSRNAVYAQLATRRLLRDDLIEVAERMGFNSRVPFDWPVPVGKLSVPYNDLEFARTAAGFQGSTLSPLGGAYLASVIAQGGLARRLRLIEYAGDFSAPRDPEPLGRVLSATTAWRIGRMMEVTVHSGTSRTVFNDEAGHNLLPGIRVAGKTGTLRPDSRGDTASWFVGFAPSRDPEIVVSVLLDNGPVWRKRAAELARDLLRIYFHRRGKPGIIDPLIDIAY